MIDNGTISYQWYFCKTENGEYNKIIGATFHRFTKKLDLDSIGYYYCVITDNIKDNGDGGNKNTNICTNKTIVSNDKINANKPYIIIQPDNNSATVQNKSLFKVKAISLDSGTITYQWYKKDPTETEFIKIEGATLDSYEVIASHVGITEVYCQIMNTIIDNWILVHDILGTSDAAGSNMYMSKYDQSNSKLKMETPWDSDTIMNIKNSFSSIHTWGIFFPMLFDSSNKKFLNTYKEKWCTLSGVLYNELNNYFTNFNASDISSSSLTIFLSLLS